MPASVLDRLRKICMALPAAEEFVSHGAPTFRVMKGKVYAMFANAETHVGKGRNGVWLKAHAENQRLMIATDPERYFYPPYVGPSGWIGVYLDKKTDWKELKNLVSDGWRLAAPKRVLKEFGAKV